ncbi:MAG: OmpA family protein, partial [Myxococcota bacterium]
ELANNVLFDSGKTELKDEGKEALTQVAQVLTTIGDRDFLIAGHTDDQRIRTKRFPNNWHLSTARAVSVLEFFVDQGFTPENLAAAGYGEFSPVAPNDDKDNRALNRRIEIILVPDLSELPNLTEEGTG